MRQEKKKRKKNQNRKYDLPKNTERKSIPFIL